MKKSATIKELLDAMTTEMSAEEILSAILCSELSAAIVKKRLKMELSQKELADQIGKTQSTISKWENGDMNFSVDLLAEIAVKLDMDLTVKLDDKEEVRRSGDYHIVLKDHDIDFDRIAVYSAKECPIEVAEV